MFSIRTTARVLFAAAFVADLGASQAAEKPRNSVLQGQVAKSPKEISLALHYANCDIGDLKYRSKAKQGTLQNGILQDTAASQAYLAHKSSAMHGTHHSKVFSHAGGNTVKSRGKRPGK